MPSILVPFKFENGKVADTEDVNLIAKQRIIDALATSKYERVNRPEYGISVNSLLFDIFDPLIFSDFRIDALTDLNDYVSNAKIIDIQISSGDDTNYGNNSESTLVVRVVYQVPGSTIQTLVTNVSAGTILTEESTI